MEYRDFNDNELLYYISEANEEASGIMYEKYNPLINNIASRLFNYCSNLGLEKNDLVQEGLLGLSLAINTYDAKKDNVFYTYARKCIESKMISLIVAARRQKHRILNESISLSEHFADDSLEFADFLGDNTYNPEYRIFEQATEEELIKSFSQKLTGFETEVFMLKLSGLNYKEISNILDKDVKAVDNALQRIKLKLKKFLKDI